MKPPTELPPVLRIEPFSVAEVLDLGVSIDRLRARDLRHPFHGVRTLNLDLSTVRNLCRSFAPRLRPGDLFSHETAARLWGLPLPLYARRGLFVSASSPARAPRTHGVIGAQLTLSAGDVSIIDGLPVTSPALTWASLAAHLRLEDLIAVGDAVVTPPFRSQTSLGSTSDLQRQVARGRNQRGQQSREAAIGEVRVGALARTESLVRVICTRAGIPEPELNAGPRGLMPDLRWVRYRVCLEYLGDGHRAVSQFRFDVGRNERFLDDDWLVMKVTADDLFDRPRELVARLARRLRSRGWVGEVDLTQVGVLLR